MDGMGRRKKRAAMGLLIAIAVAMLGGCGGGGGCGQSPPAGTSETVTGTVLKTPPEVPGGAAVDSLAGGGGGGGGGGSLLQGAGFPGGINSSAADNVRVSPLTGTRLVNTSQFGSQAGVSQGANSLLGADGRTQGYTPGFSGTVSQRNLPQTNLGSNLRPDTPGQGQAGGGYTFNDTRVQGPALQAPPQAFSGQGVKVNVNGQVVQGIIQGEFIVDRTGRRLGTYRNGSFFPFPPGVQ